MSRRYLSTSYFRSLQEFLRYIRELLARAIAQRKSDPEVIGAFNQSYKDAIVDATRNIQSKQVKDIQLVTSKVRHILSIKNSHALIILQDAVNEPYDFAEL
jgi:hypothetical protein